MPDSGGRKSRVRGAVEIRVRKDWPYPIDQFEWIERLNLVRQKIGDRNVAILTGVSTVDPSYKNVRRWTTGERIPESESYRLVNKQWQELEQESTLVNVANEVRSLFVGKVALRYQSKVNMFLGTVRPYIMRREPPQGMNPNGRAALRMLSPIYMQTCNEVGTVKPVSKVGAAITLVHVHNLQTHETHTEVGLIWIEPEPPPATLKNAIDTWVNGLPKNQTYKTWVVVGAWFSYAEMRRETGRVKPEPKKKGK